MQDPQKSSIIIFTLLNISDTYNIISPDHQIWERKGQKKKKNSYQVGPSHFKYLNSSKIAGIFSEPSGQWKISKNNRSIPGPKTTLPVKTANCHDQLT